MDICSICNIQFQQWGYYVHFITWYSSGEAMNCPCWGRSMPSTSSESCSAALPPAASLTDVKMSKRRTRKCLKSKRSSGLIRSDCMEPHSVTTASAADSWNTHRCACELGIARTTVTREAGWGRSQIQPAGARSWVACSSGMSTLAAKEHNTATSVQWYFEATWKAIVEVPARQTSNWARLIATAALCRTKGRAEP